MIIDHNNLLIAVVGLGYVGLPLAVEFGKRCKVIGYDLSESRVQSLCEGEDSTGELSQGELEQSQHLTFSNDSQSIADCNFYIVTVPTPINSDTTPNLSHLIDASRKIGEYVKKGDYVVFESTVYPGATEEVCIPEIEKVSGLKLNEHFYAGYSPERINPGDSEHRLSQIVKVTSGSTPEAALYIDEVYKLVIIAGTYMASSIKVAEAAKVIENTQRDLNIALINELSIVFEKLQLDTQEVLAAARTKWNFLDFRPGLVGGHCIGVDPYYLTHKAEQVGYSPEVILAGRKINDQMAGHIARRLVKLLESKSVPASNARVLVLGYAFKENCSDIRNTKVHDLVLSLEEAGVKVDIYDEVIDPSELIEQEIDFVRTFSAADYDAIVLAVAHDEFLSLTPQHFRSSGAKPNCVFFDIKGVWPIEEVNGRL
jgi:UDP-N-acetyl-D-glucosamine/UDP-N-acetyl-D-galactosamine dehydrogenase